MWDHLSLLIISILLLLAGQAEASHWFVVINVTPIEMTPSSEANFTISVKGLGSERAYVQLVFKNKTEGFDFSCDKMIKNVFPAGVTKFNCSVRAADLPPGNYSFVVDVAATGSPSGKKTAFINVVEPEKEMDLPAENEGISTGSFWQKYLGPASSENNNSVARAPVSTPAGNESQQIPAPGATIAILAMLFALYRKGRGG
jgi:hypothetical protein